MGPAGVIAGVCAEVGEAVFALRQAVPLTWQGEAANQFGNEVEAGARKMSELAAGLAVAAQMARVHEHHMAAMRAVMSGNPGHSGSH